MVLLFGNTAKEVFLEIRPEMVAPSLLYNWLRDKHEHIFWDIELHTTGPEGISISGADIMFSGDNGVFILERIFPEKLYSKFAH